MYSNNNNMLRPMSNCLCTRIHICILKCEIFEILIASYFHIYFPLQNFEIIIVMLTSDLSLKFPNYFLPVYININSWRKLFVVVSNIIFFKEKDDEDTID